MRASLVSFACALCSLLPSALAFGENSMPQLSKLNGTFANGTALPPSQDPFYTPDSGFANSSKPGDILRSRQFNPPVGGGAYTYQLLVRSTDSLGRPSAIVTTILAPPFGNRQRLLSVQTPYDSADVDCGPSYTQRTGGRDATADAFVRSALDAGYLINVPDYEGPYASFTNGVQSGQATLDSIRAALASTNITGVDSMAKVAMAGYSGGALASEWAAELHDKYAPELSFVGVALGGLTPNVTSVLLTVNETPFVGLAPAGLIGITSQDEEIKAYMEDLLLPLTKAKFNKASMQCLVDDIVTYANNDIGSYFNGGLDSLFAPNVTEFVNEYGIMGRRGTPKGFPIYAFKGVKDQISVVKDTDDLFKKYCDGGAQIEYVRNSTTDHLTEETVGQPYAFKWLEDRFNGIPVFTNGCNVTTV